MLVNVSDSTRDLTEDEQKPGSRELSLAELLPEKDVLRAVSLENDGSGLVHTMLLQIRLVDV